MSRRRAREHVFILLFQMTFINQEETDERIELYFEQHSHIKEEDKNILQKSLKQFFLN